MREDQLARKPVPQDHDNPAGPVPADELLVGNQTEGIDAIPADTVAKARADVTREDMSPQHQDGFRRLAAIQHVLEKEQRLLTYREKDIHKSVRWLLDIVQGIEKRKNRLEAMTSEAAQHAEALQSASPELATAHITAIEQLAKQVEANIAMLPELPVASELPFYKERAITDDFSQRKHDLLQLAEDAIFTLKNKSPRNSTERNELQELNLMLTDARRGIRRVYTEAELLQAEKDLQNVLVRATVEHDLPETLTPSTEIVSSVDAIRQDVRIWELTKKYQEVNSSIKNASLDELQSHFLPTNKNIRNDLIALFNELAPRRAEYDKTFFTRIADVIKETRNVDHMIAIRMETGDVTLREQYESDAAKIYSLGSKRQGKMPKLRKGERSKAERWPDSEEYSLNELGEDYVEVDPAVNAMVVCDGNSTGDCSAEAARLVSARVMEIFRGIPDGVDLRTAQEYVGSRISELSEVLKTMESDGGTTVIAARYFPEYNAAIMIDIGDCEAYITSASGTERVQSTLDNEVKVNASALSLAKGQTGEVQLADARKNKSIPFVRTISLRPGEALSLVTDGPRNNLPTSQDRKADMTSRINDLVNPVLAGGAPNIEALPKALNTLEDRQSGDDESGAILFAKAAA